MMTQDQIFHVLGVIVVASPALLLFMLGFTWLIGLPLSERSTARYTHAAVTIGLVAAATILGMMIAFNTRDVPIELGNWVEIQEEHFHFHLKFAFDRLSVPFSLLSFVLCGTVGAFANVYLHREPGFRRFFLFYSMFLLGMVVSSVAGTIETLFLGWELVGVSSALLVAFFHERHEPVRNGQRVWSVYRIADAAFLIAALTLHHLTGAGDFDGLMGSGSWPESVASIDGQHALIVGLLLLVAAAGKSGMVPFSGWLPRAMEGPTPSSAIFYGALSVHLGAYLLLRVSPVLAVSVPLQVCVILMGGVSAIFGAMASRVQSDVKSALAFASLTQVGIIVVEIGFGLHYIPLVHMIGHACLRTLQLLRAPSLLKDYQTLENAIGARLQKNPSVWEELLAPRQRTWLYRLSLERGYLDGFLNEYIVRPFVRAFRWADAMERRWTDFLIGTDSRESDRVPAFDESLEDLG
ncbi:oxidoreductase [bacterium]|nr:oxidoreductase [bacterium]